VIQGILGWGRRQAEARMTETFTFFTRTEQSLPPDYEPVVVETPIATVPGRLRMRAREPRDVETGGQDPVVSRLEAHVPVGSVKVGPSVFVRVVASSADPGAVGRVLRTADAPAMGQVTAWRYPVEEVS